MWDNNSPMMIELGLFLQWIHIDCFLRFLKHSTIIYSNYQLRENPNNSFSSISVSEHWLINIVLKINNEKFKAMIKLNHIYNLKQSTLMVQQIQYLNKASQKATQQEFFYVVTIYEVW